MEFKLIKEILPCLVTCYGSDCQAIFLIFCHFLAISPRKFLPKQSHILIPKKYCNIKASLRLREFCRCGTPPKKNF